MRGAPRSYSSHISATMVQELWQDFHSRRLLLHSSSYTSPPSSASAPFSSHDVVSQVAVATRDNTFDANVVMVLSVLLCALICSLGLNSIIRCALRCSTFVSATSGSADDAAAGPSAARLANTGVKKKALKKFPTISYTTEVKLPGLDTECAICLSDFATGERVRVLPKCNHGFHVRCIDKWLNSHSSCPTCRHCLIQTCNKIVGCSSAPAAAAATEELVVIRIEPLQPEGLIRTHQT